MLSLGDVSLLLTGVILISAVTIFPVIYNFFIIPTIERKVGCKLEYTMITYKIIPFGLFLGRWYEISLYIFLKHFLSVFFGRNKKVNLGKNFALEKIKYAPQSFSFFEITMSYIANISIIYLGVAFFLK